MTTPDRGKIGWRDWPRSTGLTSSYATFSIDRCWRGPQPEDHSTRQSADRLLKGWDSRARPDGLRHGIRGCHPSLNGFGANAWVGAVGLKREELARFDNHGAGLLAGMGRAWLCPCPTGGKGGDAAPTPSTARHNSEGPRAVPIEAESSIREHDGRRSASPGDGQTTATTTACPGAHHPIEPHREIMARSPSHGRARP